ncbi:hypothetical protein GCM10029963_69070 [Micromonospora andamanensis]
MTELDVSLWEIEGRHGLSYKAASIYPKRPGNGGGSPAVPTPPQRERGGGKATGS